MLSFFFNSSVPNSLFSYISNDLKWEYPNFFLYPSCPAVIKKLFLFSLNSFFKIVNFSRITFPYISFINLFFWKEHEELLFIYSVEWAAVDELKEENFWDGR